MKNIIKTFLLFAIFLPFFSYASEITPIFTPDFTSGDLLICLLLLLLVLFQLIGFLKNGLNTIKLNRFYQGNNSPDGKEFYEI